MVWVGNTSNAEFADAFRFCRERVAQLAVRRHPRELVERPAGLVKRVLFARTDRGPNSTSIQNEIFSRYGDAEFLALNAALCDGETRTGSPWQGVQHLRFSRWHEFLPIWIKPCGFTGSRVVIDGAVIVVCDRYEMAEPYLDIAAKRGQTAIWQRTRQFANLRNVAHVIWDDSVAAPASVDVWRSRIGAPHISAVPTQHSWLVTQPQVDDIRSAMAGGVSEVFTKPVSIERLFEPIVVPFGGNRPVVSN